MSNRDRIARAAEEARVASEEKAAKKATKKTAKKTAKKATKKKSTKRTAKAARMKVVWVIFNASGKPVKTFDYPDQAAGEAEAQRLKTSTGAFHELRATKVPMD